MELSPKERRKIYEEEKARIEDEERRQRMATGGSTTGLEPNVAGLLCYLAGWITGIIFLIIEQKDRFIRFHAVQSIVVFGALTVASILLARLPFVGGFFGAVIGISSFILWVVLMVKAYQGELYKVPVAGDLAERSLPLPDTMTEEEESPDQASPPEADSSRLASAEKIEQRMDNYFTGTKTARVISSSLIIAWSFILLIFFSFFHEYIAYYQPETVGDITKWTRLSLLTADYYAWLPILVTTLVLSITGHIVLIIHDRYWLRQTILITLNVLGVVTVVSLLYIYPFNFGVIPNAIAADIVSIVIRIVLVAIAVGIGIGSLIMLIRLITRFVRATST